MLIERYEEAHAAQWDQFVKASKNGTFLFQRSYMDHHRDRFPDHSLVIKNESGRSLALLPGCLTGDTYISHPGLTYGGVLSDVGMKVPLMMRAFDNVLTHLQSLGAKSFLYKAIPHIYHSVPAEEDRYSLFLARAQWIRAGMLTVLSKCSRPPYQERRARRIKRAKTLQLRLAETTEFGAYWEILSELLRRLYGATPVHTLSEIESLRQAFPERIRLFACFEGSELVAGVIIFESDRVARVQYNASTDRGREVGAVDLLFDHLLNEVYPDKPFFDFGTSEERSGLALNEGLIDQKEGFGGRAVSLDQFLIDLTAWRPGSIIGAIV